MRIVIILIALVVVFNCSALPLHGNNSKNADKLGISINILAPRQNQITDSLLYVGVTVQSTFEVQTVRACVAGRCIDLIYNAGGLQGTLNLAGLLRGAYTLTVTVIDVFNNQMTAERHIIYDKKPVVELVTPVKNDVVYSTLRLKVNFSDDNVSGGRIHVYRQRNSNDVFLFTRSGSFDTLVDLSGIDEGQYAIRLVAYDSLDQVVEISRPFLLVLSRMLVLKYQMPDNVFDFDSTRVLYGGGQQVNIFYRHENRTETINLPGNLIVTGKPYLTQSGFLAILEPSNAYLNDSVYDWRDGIFTNLGKINSSNSLVVKGKWAIWNNRQEITLRNNVTGDTVLVTNDAINIDNDVSEDGTVAYGTTGYQIFTFSSGITKKITNSGMNTYPRIGKSIILYRRGPGFDTLAMRVGDNDSVLSVKSYQTPDYEYRTCDGWVTYPKYGNLGQTHIWLRSPSGTHLRLTPFGTSSGRVELHTRGRSVFQNGSALYFADSSGNLTKFTTLSDGRTLVIENKLYLTLNNAVFEVDFTATGITPDKLSTVPAVFRLEQNFPNPFNSSTNIKYSLRWNNFGTIPKGEKTEPGSVVSADPNPHGRVRIIVYDILGREVAVLVNDTQTAGDYTVPFNASTLTSGIYLYELKADETRIVKKMVLLR